VRKSATPDRDAQRAVAGYVLAVFGPIAVAALLVPLRDELVSTNLALILVLAVVAAAVVGGRGPGAVAAIVATVSYDFFLTRPYLSFQIDSTDDIETTVLLLVIGLIVGQLTLVAQRGRTAAARGSAELARLHRVADLVASGAAVDVITTEVSTELTRMLGLRECRFESPPFPEAPYGIELPRVERNGAVTGVLEHRFVDRGFALPEEGAVLPVLGRGTEVGRFVLEPAVDQGVSVEELVVAVALADQLGAAIAAS
jgi:Domain of unknown function (DUF4118)